MLVITRKLNEEIVVGDPSSPIGRIKVADIQGERVKIACDFPVRVPINRAEVAEKVIAARSAPAARPSPLPRVLR